VGTRLNYKRSFLTAWLLNRNHAGRKCSKFDYIDKNWSIGKRFIVKWTWLNTCKYKIPEVRRKSQSNNNEYTLQIVKVMSYFICYKIWYQSGSANCSCWYVRFQIIKLQLKFKLKDRKVCLRISVCCCCPLGTRLSLAGLLSCHIICWNKPQQQNLHLLLFILNRLKN